MRTSYQERTYRHSVTAKDLKFFQVVVRETDLWIGAESDLEKETRDLVFLFRHQLETYMGFHREFLTSLSPVEDDPMAPPIVKDMIRSSRKADVGPMASVAGAMAQWVGEALVDVSGQIIVENGGDIFMVAKRPVTVSIFAGPSPLSEKFGLRIPERQMPLGICSSSATVGHSLSRGITDVVCLLSKSTALADAAATALGNRVREISDLERVALWAEEIGGILGGVVIVRDAMASWGDIELVEV
ncbi:MAG: UPF0280 family protein [Deltaproteobacteria bacterium]|nr:UPF0280 family protein [Deltaproteobacteria bacterium]